MSTICTGLVIAAAMVLLALANTSGAIGEIGYEIGFCGLLAASVVAIGGGDCRWLAR